MPTRHHLDAYLRHLRDDLHRSPRTLRGSEAELDLLLRRGVVFAHPAIADFVTRSAEGHPLAATTRNRRLSTVRGFVRYLVEGGVLVADPTIGIRRAKVTRPVRAALGVDELARVVHALLAEPASWRRTRDGTILLLSFYTGLRLSELVALDVHQVDAPAGVIRSALRKGGGLTDVVLHPRLADQLAVWLRVRPAGLHPRALFVPERGGRLSGRAVQKRLRRLGEAAGLGVSLHPHLLRHAHATGLLREGVATAVIQASMNHHALATTEIYLHGDLGLVREGVRRLPELPLVGE